jgi:signal transduction histidine kinase
MRRLRSLQERSGTVRTRTTAGAVVVVGLALISASVALVVFLRRSLTEDIRATALLRAEAIADQIEAGLPIDNVPLGTDDDEFVQLLGPQGGLVASTRNLSGRPLVRPVPGEIERLSVPFDDDPFLAVAVAADAPQRNYTVVVGHTLDSVVESTTALASLLAVGVPALLILVGAVTWRVVGRSLAPVESIRSEVDAISSTELHRRVPVPQSVDEIARLATTMNRMLARLEEGQIRERRFVSDASHELRSPVATIRQNAEVALAHPDGSSTEDLATLVLAEGLRLQRLVEDLLLLARMDEGASDARKAIVDLDDIVFAEIDRIEHSTDKRIDASRVSAARVLGDSKQLARLVVNLLHNAVQHANTAVAVSLYEEGREAILQVEDDGPGIPPSDRDRIFGRFIRREDARDRDSGGTGLGLAIVAEVAIHHGGTARALDSALGGARFEIRLPRKSD